MSGFDDLGSLHDAIVREVSQTMVAAGEVIAAEAHVSITEGSASSGRHFPSKPGEPPNNDLGSLVKNIEVVQVAPLRVEVSSNITYAAALEFGTSKMAARPYMRPAAEKTRDEVTKLIAGAVGRAVRRHFRR